MLPILQLGPLAIQLSGLFLLLGVWVGVSLAERSAPKHGVDAAALANLIFIGLAVGLVGARLGYAARFPDVYAASPLSLLALTPVTLSVSSGMAAGGIACLIYGQRRQLPLWAALDSLTPALAALGVAVGLAHWSSGDAFGAPTALPWAVDLWGAQRHPTQVYEILAALAILGLILLSERRAVFPAFQFLAFAALTAAARLFLEAFRGDSVIVLDGLRQAQIVSLVVLLLALVGMHLRARGVLASSPDGASQEAV
jgi:phosphatidylglycerol:prolipoprotein diacylglycerol transferase